MDEELEDKLERRIAIIGALIMSGAGDTYTKAYQSGKLAAYQEVIDMLYGEDTDDVG